MNVTKIIRHSYPIAMVSVVWFERKVTQSTMIWRVVISQRVRGSGSALHRTIMTFGYQFLQDYVA